MVTTSLVDVIAAKATGLPMELQREVLNFVEFLWLKMNSGIATQSTEQHWEEERKPPVRNVIGLFDHLGINITDEDIAEARREMWGNFPRDIRLLEFQGGIK